MGILYIFFSLKSIVISSLILKYIQVFIYLSRASLRSGCVFVLCERKFTFPPSPNPPTWLLFVVITFHFNNIVCKAFKTSLFYPFDKPFYFNFLLTLKVVNRKVGRFTRKRLISPPCRTRHNALALQGEVIGSRIGRLRYPYHSQALLLATLHRLMPKRPRFCHQTS